MKLRLSELVLMLLALFGSGSALAMALDKSSKVTVTIGSGMSVDLYAKATRTGQRPSNDYFYVPSRARVASASTGEPQITMLTYVSDGSDQPSGGTFNAMVSWGLTEEEEDEVRTRLRDLRSGARLMGAAPLETVEQGPSVNVLAALGGEEKIAWSGVAALQPGGRSAIVANLSPVGAQLLDVGIQEGNLAGITIEMNFLLPFHVDFGNCVATVNWDSLRRDFESQSITDVTTGTGWFQTSRNYRNDQLFNVSYGIERGHVSSDCHYDRATDEQQEFFETAIAAFVNTQLASSQAALEAEREAEDEPADEEDDDDADDSSRKPDVDRFYYRRLEAFLKRRSGRQTIAINRSTVVREPAPPVIGNVRDWVAGYEDHPGVRIKSINISRSEFDQVEVMFSLGETAIEMFGLNDEVRTTLNNVQVEIRKSDSGGKPFTDYHVFGKDEVRDGNLDHTFEFARGSSASPFEYEYAITYNYVGRRPDHVEWRDADSRSHTLSPDTRSARVLFRADPSALADTGIMGATAQIKYQHLGREQTTNLNVFPSDDPQDTAVIFVDGDSTTVAIRTVFTHQNHGELATDWNVKTVPSAGAMPVFAIIPDELRSQEPEFLDRARAAVTDAAARELDDILEEFSQL